LKVCINIDAGSIVVIKIFVIILLCNAGSIA